MGKDNGFTTVVGLLSGVILGLVLGFALGLEVGKSKTAIETRPPVVIRDTIPEPQNIIVITRTIEVR